nr:MAG TPA: hypothetical protein [Caudoviricetes sp.]
MLRVTSITIPMLSNLQCKFRRDDPIKENGIILLFSFFL